MKKDFIIILSVLSIILVSCSQDTTENIPATTTTNIQQNSSELTTSQIQSETSSSQSIKVEPTGDASATKTFKSEDLGFQFEYAGNYLLYFNNASDSSEVSKLNENVQVAGSPYIQIRTGPDTPAPSLYTKAYEKIIYKGGKEVHVYVAYDTQAVGVSYYIGIKDRNNKQVQISYYELGLDDLNLIINSNTKPDMTRDQIEKILSKTDVENSKTWNNLLKIAETLEFIK